MKKFTFMLLAAFIAVSSWAQPTAVKGGQLLPEQYAVTTAKTLKQAPQMKKEMAPRQSLKGKMQAPVQKTIRKAASKKAEASDALLTALLSGEPVTFMVKSNVYDIENLGTDEEPDYQAVPQNIFRVTEDWTITLDVATMTVSITGINGGETAVTGTVDASTMSISIPYGQATGTSSYGTLGLASATGAAENLVLTLNGDVVEFGDIWEIDLIDGDYAGSQWSNLYVSEAVMPNGKMTWDSTEVDVDIDIDTENYVATVWNFGDEAVAVDVKLKNGGKFVIESQLVYEGGSTYGNFYTYDEDCVTPQISGTGTENTLTFSGKWTFFAPETGYWFGSKSAATITFDGIFVYPELTDTPATPANPSVKFFDFWNGENATVTAVIPCEDVDGKDLMSSLLSYQFYTKDDTGALVALGEAFAYDDKENGTGDNKTVLLGEEAIGLTLIGVKSIYVGGGETNESEIGWFEIPQLVELPAGVVAKEYPVTSTAYYNTGGQEYEATALVGFDGNDVYIQGILPQCPNGWAKGTLADGVATFPVQCVGTYNGGYIYLASYGTAPGPITFSVVGDNAMFVSEDYILANSYTDDFLFYYPYFAGMTIGEYSPVGDFTFNFNEMDVATSSNVSTDGDITETLELTEGSVKLAISPKEEGKTTENRFWSTNNGPQLRVYSGTLTFTVPKGYVITGITFNHNGKWGANTVDGEVIPNDADAKVATWTGSSQTVVVTIAANTQIDQITVKVEEAPEVAATPAAPAFDSLVLVGTTYPKLYLNVPTVDVDEYPINTEKLYYTIWYELADGKAQQFVVKADEYESITEDVVEVPYTYDDGWDIYEAGRPFYLNPANFDYTAWKRIGVQSVYYGADERRESEITWITPVNVTSAKYATFYAPVDVDFTGNEVSAYAATFDGEYVQLAPVTTVPAGTAVVVKAEAAGTYVVNETTDAVLGATNELLAATADVVADGTQYVLAKVDDVVGFYKVNTGSTIAAGKGYMVFETAVKPFYAFGEDDATGISGIVADENAVIYNLAGQRVSKAVKGINIINGKKVLK